ncbi:MAG: Colicin V production protein [Candidatus Magasanikbacteria bacterium GW2011_GWC2_37_14]|uniref:Colicin V production protein n=1 Tax=Candidatus Magasanikbacteria bacterium GW2011_GWC2_37_14 TaxID=1619046 RepID=A0A0G0JJ07_9BACT|nr:MAG: Colicin V production protein [Candidatus Magasanikbacteria bacterium GW2011_GWC2_37_14]
MSLFDIILLIIIGGFTMFGFWFGLIHTLGSLLGTVFGAYLAARFYEPMAGWLMNITGWGGNISKVLMFIIAFIIINRLVGFAFWIVEKITNVITYLPFIQGINRLLGMILGLAEGLITLGLIFYFIERFPLSDTFMQWMANSVVVPYTLSIAAVLIPLLPEALKMLKSTVDYVEHTLIKL